jgi:hypothetical protein
MTGITWYKRWDGSVFDPMFSAVATEAQSDHCRACAVWRLLLERTSHLKEFVTIDLLRKVAAGLHLTLGEVERIWKAFVSLGMVVGIGDPPQPATSVIALNVDHQPPATDFRGEVSRYLTTGRGK